jgi:hypothetical protein
MAWECGRQLVEYKGKLVSVCNPEYAFRNQPIAKIFFGVVVFLICLTIFIFLLKLCRKVHGLYKENKINVGSFIATILLTIIFLYISIWWLIFSINSFTNLS